MTDDAPAAPAALLSVEHLSCCIETPDGPVRLVDDVSFELSAGSTLGIVGESGSGKSMLVRSLMGIGPRAAELTGKVVLNGIDVMALRPADRGTYMGATIGMVFQNPVASLNPVVPIGRQITEGMRCHHGVGRKEARARALDLLVQCGISDPGTRLAQYPFQLSGGMCQRVAIAAALACDPKILIADEATTALDVTVQRQILDLLQELQRSRNMSLILISHDLGVVAGRSDQVAVMYSGQMIESGPTDLIFARYQHRYTEALLSSVPRLTAPPRTRLATIAGSPHRPIPDQAGCRFAPRCRVADDLCRVADPPVAVVDAAGHWHRCVRPVERGLEPVR